MTRREPAAAIRGPAFSRCSGYCLGQQAPAAAMILKLVGALEGTVNFVVGGCGG